MYGVWTRALSATIVVGFIACDRATAIHVVDVSVDASARADLRPTLPSPTPNNITFSNNIAFVTSWKGTGDLGGVAAGDAICRRLAASAGLPGTYVAWLSSATIAAKDRLGSARGWIRRDGKPLADWIEDLGRRLLHPIVLDEHGLNIGLFDAVFTSTRANGVTDPDGNCGDWTDTTRDARVGLDRRAIFGAIGDNECLGKLPLRRKWASLGAA